MRTEQTGDPLSADHFSVLIVDDDKSDRQGIQDFLDWKGLGVTMVGTARDGREGYGKALELRPDLIVTDVAMPLMDGLEMTERIKKELPDTRFIFMSCYDNFEYAKSAVEFGVYSYVLKPINIGELEEAIRQVKRLRDEEIAHRDRDRDMETMLRESRPLLQEQFVAELLCGRIKDEAEMLRRMEYLEIGGWTGYYLVVWVQLDRFQALTAEMPMERQYVLLQRLREAAESGVVRDWPGRAAAWDQSNTVIILFPALKDRKEALESVIDRLESFRDRINSGLGVQVTCGVSSFSDSLVQAQDIACQARNAARSRFHEGGNRIILASDVVAPCDRLEFQFQQLMQEASSLIETDGSVDGIREFAERHFGKTVHCRPHMVRSFLYSFVSILQVLLAEKSTDLEDVFSGKQDLWGRVEYLDTLQDIEEWLVDVISRIQGHLKQTEGTRYHKIIADLKTTVDDHYGEIDNIHEAVEPLQISASYANYLFRKETRMTIFEYLTQRRIEAAKELLKDPYCRVAEVADRIGYKSVSYFSALFKERVGLTPKQYANRYAG